MASSIHSVSLLQGPALSFSFADFRLLVSQDAKDQLLCRSIRKAMLSLCKLNDGVRSMSFVEDELALSHQATGGGAQTELIRGMGGWTAELAEPVKEWIYALTTGGTAAALDEIKRSSEEIIASAMK